MKFIFLLALFANIILANTYYAKVEPINTYNIKSSVSGKVIDVNNNIEASIVKNNYIVKIDDKLNQIELKETKIKLHNLKEVLNIHKQTLNSFNKVSSKSKFEKNKQKIIILNTKTTLSDLKLRVATLEDLIKNKTLIEKNRYISNINVKVGDFVNPGMLLYTAQDLSKAKLVIFVSFDDIKTIKNKTIYINEKKTNLKIDKIYKTADNTHISAYKVEIILQKVKNFSSLVKISFK